MRRDHVHLMMRSVLHLCLLLDSVNTFTTECRVRTSSYDVSFIGSNHGSDMKNIFGGKKRRRKRCDSYFDSLRTTDRTCIRMMQPQDDPLSQAPAPTTLGCPLESSSSTSKEIAVENQAKILSQFERTRKHFEKLQQQQKNSGDDDDDDDMIDITDTPSSMDNKLDPIGMERERIYESYIQLPASDLKKQCVQRQISDKGRKPDLAQRLTQDDIISVYGLIDHGKEEEDNINEGSAVKTLINGMAIARDDATSMSSTTTTELTNFAGLYPLSVAAKSALTLAQFVKPTIIQSKAIPILSSGRSAIIHAATGSGKTLAYLLPFTERLWREHASNNISSNKIAMILTPTRELAAQVAGIASILSPPGTVRFVTRPSNLLSRMKQERADGTNTVEATTRIYVGSAKAIYQSLYGDGRMPASPTSKPEAMFLLQNTGYLVLDEVDRLLGVVGGVNNNNNSNPSYGKKSKSQDTRNDNIQKGINHEKPAAILTAAVARLALGKATTVAASATVGRPLRRELARCMGLTPQECPIIVRDNDMEDDIDTDVNSDDKSKVVTEAERPKSNISTTGRAVTIPSTVNHYVVPVVDGTSPGKILTTAFTAIQALGPHRRMLLVLTRNFGITTQNAIGALKHFRCNPEPISLLDALETTDGIEAMMEVHRQVTGVRGVGGSQPLLPMQQQQGYLLVTGEDSVRGLHLDGLDVVLVASRSVGPDEYTHIAGRTGRAGKSGSVINVVSDVDVSKVTAWEKMLNITFILCPTPKEIGSLIEIEASK